MLDVANDIYVGMKNYFGRNSNAPIHSLAAANNRATLCVACRAACRGPTCSSPRCGVLLVAMSENTTCSSPRCGCYWSQWVNHEDFEHLVARQGLGRSTYVDGICAVYAFVLFKTWITSPMYCITQILNHKSTANIPLTRRYRLLPLVIGAYSPWRTHP